MKKSQTSGTWVMSQIFSIIFVFLIWYFIPDILYTYMAIAVFSIAAIVSLLKIIGSQNNAVGTEKKASPEIEWNTKNIMLLSGALLFMVSAILYGVHTANEQLAQKRKKMMTLPIQEIADYIIDHNNHRRIGPITKIDRILYKGHTLTFYYQIEGGILEKAASSMQSIEEFRKRVTGEFKTEDCSKTSFSVFLDKNGTIHYIYHNATDGNETFMFDINITKEMCSK